MVKLERDRTGRRNSIDQPLASRVAHGEHDVVSPLDRVLALQRTDGGFGAHTRGPSATEPTALALLALSFEAVDAADPASQRACEWLVGLQTADGGFPVTSGSTEPAWTTSLVVLALARVPAAHEAALRGARWLLGEEGRRPSGRRTLVDWLLGRRVFPTAATDALPGWPWVRDTFSWVEPTAYAVLALEGLRPDLPQEAVASRIDLARRMIADRRCEDGGWNYGNSSVLGEALWGYPDTTALALLALDRDGAAPDASLAALDRMLVADTSGLATALGILALARYGRDVRALRTRLRARIDRTGLLGETRALAWACLALNERADPFGRGRAHA